MRTFSGGPGRQALHRAGWLACALVCFATLPVRAQSGDEMGVVVTHDVRLTGGMQVDGQVARLLSNVGLTAQSFDVPIALHRGGHVLVCSTSEFHLLRSGAAGALVFGLDRGAVEISSEGLAQDAILTPDLKLVPVTKGPLDVRLRVTREGDTCVDNAGETAPVLNVTDPFSSASYRLLPGQHVLFVKGDLHQVVDHERSPCGCPSTSPLQTAVNGKPLTKAQAAAAAAHPFPAAQSEGLAAPEEPGNAAPVGEASSQVSTTFSYGEHAARPAGIDAAPAAEPEKPNGFFHSIGRFFHRLFGGKDE